MASSNPMNPSPSSTDSASKTTPIRINEHVHGQPLRQPQFTYTQMPNMQSLPPQQGIQYMIHPSMPSVPMIVVPNINMLNLNLSTNTVQQNQLNADKLNKILEKQQSNKTLNNKEQTFLQSAISNTHQQCIKFYQLNQVQHALTPQQIAAIQQQQILHQMQLQQHQQRVLLAQQQQLQQQQLAANSSPWITTNQYPMDMNANRANAAIPNPYIHSQNNHYYQNKNSYFGLPDAFETERSFCNEHNGKTCADKVISLNAERYHQTIDSNWTCCSVKLDGLGILRLRDSIKKKKTNCRNDELYQRLRVKDLSEDCCQWLVSDLQHLQNEAENQRKRQNVSCKTKQISMSIEDESESKICGDLKIKQIVSHSSSILHSVYNGNKLSCL